MDPKPDKNPGPGLRPDIVARVVAWHNRQPLARRITPDQVRGIGVVALPFLAAGGGAAGGVARPAGHHAGGRAGIEPPWGAEDGPGADRQAPAGAEDAELSLPERAAARLQAGDGEPAVPPDGDAAAEASHPGVTASESAVDASNPNLLPATGALPAAQAAEAAGLAPATPSRFAKLARWWPLRRATAGGASGAALTPAFSEDFIAPIKPRQVARFARRHGSAERPGDSAEPQRDVLANGQAGGAPRPVVLLYLRSAAIEVGDRRLRVLVGSGGKPAVVGPRLWSRPRIGGAAVLGLSCLLASAATLWLPGRPAADDGAAKVALNAAPASSAAPAASAAAVHGAASGAEAAASEHQNADAAPALPSVAEPDAAAASAPAGELHASDKTPVPAAAAAETAAAQPPHGQAGAAAEVAAAAPSTPVPGDAAGGAEKQAASVRPDIRPQLTAEQRDAARREGEQLRAQAPARKGAARAAGAGGAASDGHNYALVTRATRGRAASEVMLSLMVSAAAGAPGPGQPRTEVMQVPQGWRAVWWPFGSLGDAEGARAALAQYGINAEIVEF